MSIDVADCKARLARGEQLPGGVAWNPDRNPEFYEMSKEDVAVAEGNISVSYDGRTVTDLATGKVTTREQPDRFKANRPVTLAEQEESASATTGKSK